MYKDKRGGFLMMQVHDSKIIRRYPDGRQNHTSSFATHCSGRICG
jgi:hypothetical protein